ncbi:MAG: shikimate kinase [Desulfovibrionaceae bacterium]|nr:shikimate kinase [Desulfovibrionaceae bacterium]
MSEKDVIIQSINKSIPCISLIGMPGAGKTTIGKRLANRLRWPYIDSDHVIEACYGHRLQDVVDATDKQGFIELEARIVQSLRIRRCVLGTGGSVVYSDEAMTYLSACGCIVYLDVPLETLADRIAANPDRGIACAPGQTLADLYAERVALYHKWAEICCPNNNVSPDDCVSWICDHLPERIGNYLSL